MLKIARREYLEARERKERGKKKFDVFQSCPIWGYEDWNHIKPELTESRKNLFIQPQPEYSFRITLTPDFILCSPFFRSSKSHQCLQYGIACKKFLRTSKFEQKLYVIHSVYGISTWNRGQVINAKVKPTPPLVTLANLVLLLVKNQSLPLVM